MYSNSTLFPLFSRTSQNFKKVVNKRDVSKIQGVDLEITTAAALRGHSRGHSSPKKITALPSNQTVNTSIELINTSIELINTSIELINTSIENHAALAFSFIHALNIMFTSPQAITQSLLSCYKRSSLPTRASVAFTCITCIHCDCMFRRWGVGPLQIFSSNSGITYRLASLDIQIDYNSCPLQSGQHYNLPAKLLWKDCGLYSGPSSRIQVETQYTIWVRNQAAN